MSFTRLFDGKATLEELERACMNIQMVRMANVTNIEGRNGELEGERIDVNVVTFDPKDRPRQVRSNLKFVAEDDADFAQMATEGRTQLGGPGKTMDVFVDGAATTILVFFKMD